MSSTSEMTLAKKHPMDIPHVTAVEFPLVVKNEDKAITMIGGKQKVADVINNVNNKDLNNDNFLELKLRKDPFHHPLQSSMTKKEKILLRVSIPKKNLPQDYYENPNKYSIQQLMMDNKRKEGPKCKVQPVAIVNKTYSFKSMTDFQISTKNNQTIQEFNKVTNAKNFDTIKEYFDKHDGLQDILDYSQPESYQNKDHGLPPPPLFSNTNLPFDFKYQKNPYTTVLRDEKGETKVVKKKDDIKLHSKIIEFQSEDIPIEPAPELIKNYDRLIKSDLTGRYSEYHLLECIKWLKSCFDVKPMWLRKHLDDIIPENLKRYVKVALPYISFIYKSGPWRFSYIKYGIDPKVDKSLWKYQCEYFRIQGIKVNVDKNSKSRRFLPRTVKEVDSTSNLKISEHLIFTGEKVPQTVTYQLGDILDEDVQDLISNTSDDQLFRDSIDFQDGWVSKQIIETIRRIIRYKLGQLVAEEPIDPIKVSKLVQANYLENDNNYTSNNNNNRSNNNNNKSNDDIDNSMVIDGDFTKEESKDDRIDDTLLGDEENEELDELEEEETINELSEQNLLNKLDQLDPKAADKLRGIIGYVKQDSIM